MESPAPEAGMPAETVPLLTREQALELQDVFIAEYEKVTFQQKLKEHWGHANGDTKLQEKARLEVCLPVQFEALARFGFEGSRSGVQQAIAAFASFDDDPDVMLKHRKLASLTNPALREVSDDSEDSAALVDLTTGKSDSAAPLQSSLPAGTALVEGGELLAGGADLGRTAPATGGAPLAGGALPLPTGVPLWSATAGKAGGEPSMHVPKSAPRSTASPPGAATVSSPTTLHSEPTVPLPDKFAAPDLRPDAEDSKIWAVVGGQEKGGIIVRFTQATNSKQLAHRLQYGARIEEREKVGDRLHFKRLHGDGPDFGWVSISYKGAPLLKEIDRDEFLTQILPL